MTSSHEQKMSPAQLLAEARACVQAGDTTSAEKLLRRVPAGSPFSPEAVRLLGVLYFARDDFARAERAFAQVLRAPGAGPADRMNHGLALAALGQTRKAEATFRQALEVDPAFVEAWFNLGNLQRETQDYAGAEASYNHALELAPNDIRILFNLGLTLLAARTRHADRPERQPGRPAAEPETG